MKINPDEVGKRIRRIRKASSQTQVQFAKEIGVKKQNYVSRYERGRIPSPDILAKISDAGSVSIDWILRGKEFKK